MNTLGDRLKHLRKEKGYTLEQVANKVNTTKITLSRYENNLRDPKIIVISKLAKLYNVSIDYLQGFTNENKDIKILLENLLTDLTNKENLEFDGQPMNKESINTLLSYIEVGLEFVKKYQYKHAEKIHKYL